MIYKENVFFKIIYKAEIVRYTHSALYLFANRFSIINFLK